VVERGEENEGRKHGNNGEQRKETIVWEEQRREGEKMIGRVKGE